MKGCEVIYLLVLFTVAPTIAQNEDLLDIASYVNVRDTTVTLTCPESESVMWRKDSKDEKSVEVTLQIDDYTDKNNGLYNCKSNDKYYFFYTKMKVCDGCVELDTGLVIALMFGDVLITSGVILIIYVCAKRKAAPAPSQRAAHSRQANAPPPPDPDYQMLNQATRSKDIYAEARRQY